MDSIIKYPLEEEIRTSVEKDGYYQLLWVKKDKQGNIIAEITTDEPLDIMVDIGGELVGVDKDFRKISKTLKESPSRYLYMESSVDKDIYSHLYDNVYVRNEYLYKLIDKELVLQGKVFSKE